MILIPTINMVVAKRALLIPELFLDKVSVPQCVVHFREFILGKI